MDDCQGIQAKTVEAFELPPWKTSIVPFDPLQRAPWRDWHSGWPPSAPPATPTTTRWPRRSSGVQTEVFHRRGPLERKLILSEN